DRRRENVKATRRRTCNVVPGQGKLRTVTWAVKLRVLPLRQAAEVCAHTVQRDQAVILCADDMEAPFRLRYGRATGNGGQAVGRKLKNTAECAFLEAGQREPDQPRARLTEQE